MTKEMFIDKIRNHKVLKDLHFIIGAETLTDITVIALDNLTHTTKMSFIYNMDGSIIYKLNVVGDCSIYETKRWLNALVDIID